MKTYQAATYLKVRDAARVDKLRELLSTIASQEAADNAAVDVDEVRNNPSINSIRVSLLIRADSAPDAADAAERFVQSVLNLVPDWEDSLSRRQDELSYV